MSLSETSVDSLSLAIANSGSWERMTYFLPLIRLLSHGHPVSREQLATALERPFEEVTEVLRQFEDIVSDEDGCIVGAGLSLLPTPYRFEVNGHGVNAILIEAHPNTWGTMPACCKRSQ